MYFVVCWLIYCKKSNFHNINPIISCDWVVNSKNTSHSMWKSMRGSWILLHPFLHNATTSNLFNRVQIFRKIRILKQCFDHEQFEQNTIRLYFELTTCTKQIKSIKHATQIRPPWTRLFTYTVYLYAKCK